MIEHSIKITGLRRTNSPAWPNGDRLLCLFDAEVRGFGFDGCLLIRAKRGVLTAQLPKAPNYTGNPRSVWIIDGAIRSAMIAAAADAYVMFGGDRGDVTEIPDGAEAAE